MWTSQVWGPAYKCVYCVVSFKCQSHHASQPAPQQQFTLALHQTCRNLNARIMFLLSKKNYKKIKNMYHFDYQFSLSSDMPEISTHWSFPNIFHPHYISGKDGWHGSVWSKNVSGSQRILKSGHPYLLVKFQQPEPRVSSDDVAQVFSVNFNLWQTFLAAGRKKSGPRDWKASQFSNWYHGRVWWPPCFSSSPELPGVPRLLLLFICSPGTMDAP